MLLGDFQENRIFMIFDPHDVINVTWRRVLRTPLPLPEGVPQVLPWSGSMMENHEKIMFQDMTQENLGDV